jgi:transcriptional regulator with XRE-family HTH domain
MQNSRVKAIREALGMTQTVFSKSLGITCASLSRIESGIQILTKSMGKLICFVFNVNEEWLLEGKGEMFKSVKEADEIKKLLGIFDKLIDINKKLIINHADYLLKSQEDLQALQTETPAGKSRPAAYPLEPLPAGGYEEDRFVG